MDDDIPQLPRFTYDDAWRVGSELREHCRTEGHAVTIAIWLGDQRVFHAACAGTSADQDAWLDRKARIVRRFRASSREVGRRYVDPAAGGVEAFLTAFALPTAEYFPAGGAVPIYVQGHLVGVIGVSGLSSEQDHDLAIGALRAAAAS